MLLPCSAISSSVYWKGEVEVGHHSIYQRLSCLPVWGRSKKQASIENRGDDRRQRPDCLPCPRLGKMCPVYSSLPSGHNSRPARSGKDPMPAWLQFWPPAKEGTLEKRGGALNTAAAMPLKKWAIKGSVAKTDLLCTTL